MSSTSTYHEQLAATLRAVADETACYEDGPRPYSGDSYLPEHIKAMIRAALGAVEAVRSKPAPSVIASISANVCAFCESQKAAAKAVPTAVENPLAGHELVASDEIKVGDLLVPVVSADRKDTWDHVELADTFLWSHRTDKHGCTPGGIYRVYRAANTTEQTAQPSAANA